MTRPVPLLATFSQGGPYDGQLYVYPDGLSTDFLTELGFSITPGLEEFAPESGSQALISGENVDLLEADVVVFATESQEMFEETPGLRHRRQPARGRGGPRGLHRRDPRRSHLLRHPAEPHLPARRAHAAPRGRPPRAPPRGPSRPDPPPVTSHQRSTRSPMTPTRRTFLTGLSAMAVAGLLSACGRRHRTGHQPRATTPAAAGSSPAEEAAFPVDDHAQVRRDHRSRRRRPAWCLPRAHRPGRAAGAGDRAGRGHELVRRRELPAASSRGPQDALGDAELPAVLEDTNGVEIEKVAALAPDLIVGAVQPG